MPRLLVTDANILIDLALVDRHFILLLPNCEVVTTVDVFDELDPDQQDSWQPYIVQGQLVLEDIDVARLEAIQKSVSSRLSTVDCTAIVLAEQCSAILLSGDQLMVRTYRNRGQEAHGLLWLLDENERLTVCTPAKLCSILTNIMKQNQQLPVQLCQERLKRWGGNDLD